MRDLRDGSGLIILDESTRALVGDDLARVHAMLRRLAATGSSAVMISHNLGELMSVTDRVSILRDGRLVGTGLATGFDFFDARRDRLKNRGWAHSGFLP